MDKSLKPFKPLQRLIVKRLIHHKEHSSSAVLNPTNNLPILHHVPTIEPHMSHKHTRHSSTTSVPVKLAVLHQALPPPTLNGVTKPPKPGGYKDSGADIAFAVARGGDPAISVITPVENPNPAEQDDWTFPDTPEGLHAALEQGATHIWANVHSFGAHPLQTLRALDKFEGSVKIVGQPPRLADYADDKALFNEHLRERANELGLRLPEAVVVGSADKQAASVESQLDEAVERLGLPVIVKPPRGRGSSGVKRCDTVEALKGHVAKLLGDGPRVLVEEFLTGEEGTVAVLPPVPNESDGQYTALPFVQRYDHKDGVMAYIGDVPMTMNSRAMRMEEIEADKTYSDAMRQCETVARQLEATAVTRIDVRRGKDGQFRVFDSNLKPVSTITPAALLH